MAPALGHGASVLFEVESVIYPFQEISLDRLRAIVDHVRRKLFG